MKLLPIEKCMDNVPNIFNLILVASRRARQLANGNPPKMKFDRTEKPTITSLEEIGQKLVDDSILDEEVPTYKERNNLGFSGPGPMLPLSAFSRLTQNNKDENEDSDLRHLEDSELGLTNPTQIEE